MSAAKCEVCGELLTHPRVSESGSVSLRCDDCDASRGTTAPEATGAETIFYPEAMGSGQSTDPEDVESPKFGSPAGEVPSRTLLFGAVGTDFPPQSPTKRQGLLLVEGVGRARFPLSRARTVVGREGADFEVADPTVSCRHFEIVTNGASYVIRDLGSSNGTLLNDHEIRSARLEPGDVIRAGETTFNFRIQEVVPLDPDDGPPEASVTDFTARGQQRH